MLSRAQLLRRGLGVAGLALVSPRELLALLEPAEPHVAAAVAPTAAIASTWNELLIEYHQAPLRALLNQPPILLELHRAPVYSGDTVRIPLVLTSA